MKHRLISYYDRKINVYNPVICLPDSSDEDLIEGVRRMCASPKVNSQIFDFDLYSIGVFDDKLGSCVLNDKPEFLVSLADFRYLQEVKEDVKGS